MKQRSLIIYDLLGAGITALIVAVAGWCGFSHLPATAAVLIESRAALADAKTQLNSAEHALRQQQATQDALRADIASRGALPERSPVETDLRTIVRLAREHELELIEVAPINGKSYPGIAELRYAVRARGTYSGLLGFLNTFEQSPFWADVTSLEISAPRVAEADQGQRTASLTVSLFASQAPPEDQTEP